MQTKIFRALSLAGLVWLAGCSSEDEWSAKRPKVFPASGTITLDGNPLEGATIIYHSQAHNISAQGISDANGKYVLTSFNQDDGAAEGEHKVVVSKFAYEEKKTKYDSAEEKSVALIPKDLLPKRYATPDTTPLTASVSSSGPNNATLELKSK